MKNQAWGVSSDSDCGRFHCRSELTTRVELAQLADRLGYTRYWLAEHYGTPALTCASPEVLIGPVAAWLRIESTLGI